MCTGTRLPNTLLPCMCAAHLTCKLTAASLRCHIVVPHACSTQASTHARPPWPSLDWPARMHPPLRSCLTGHMAGSPPKPTTCMAPRPTMCMRRTPSGGLGDFGNWGAAGCLCVQVCGWPAVAGPAAAGALQREVGAGCTSAQGAALVVVVVVVVVVVCAPVAVWLVSLYSCLLCFSVKLISFVPQAHAEAPVRAACALAPAALLAAVCAFASAVRIRLHARYGARTGMHARGSARLLLASKLCLEWSATTSEFGRAMSTAADPSAWRPEAYPELATCDLQLLGHNDQRSGGGPARGGAQASCTGQGRLWRAGRGGREHKKGWLHWPR